MGQLIYHLSGRKVLKYPEERQGFVIPDRYLRPKEDSPTSGDTTRHARPPNSPDFELSGPRSDETRPAALQERPEASNDETLTAVGSRERVGEEGNVIVVDWYGDDDPENPQNW